MTTPEPPPLTTNQHIAADALDPETDGLLNELLARSAHAMPRSTADLDLLIARSRAQLAVQAEALAWRRAEPGPTTAWEGHPIHALVTAVDALIALESPGAPDHPQGGGIAAQRPAQRPDGADAAEVEDAVVAVGTDARTGSKS
jgi:hypothetical protein